MNHVSTAMRDAFSVAVSKTPQSTGTKPLITSALKRKVGVTVRKTMWSVKRGNR